MSLNIPARERCFIDANILYYYFVNHPQFSTPVTNLLKRLALHELVAFSAVPVVADALHRVMLSEVEMLYLKPKALAHVQRHPEMIASLMAYPQAIRAALSLPIELLVTDASLLVELAMISSSCHSMTNDALIVATMRRHGIQHLITNDDDFDNVPSITVWKPR